MGASTGIQPSTLALGAALQGQTQGERGRAAVHPVCPSATQQHQRRSHATEHILLPMETSMQH